VQLRYAIAQALIVFFWAVDWSSRGAYSDPTKAPLENLLGSFIIIFLFTGLPALVVGMIDGMAGRRNGESLIRQTILSVLVIAFAAFVTFIGIDALKTEDLFGMEGPRPPSVAIRIDNFVCVEFVFLMEWGIAAVIRWLRSISEERT